MCTIGPYCPGDSGTALHMVDRLAVGKEQKLSRALFRSFCHLLVCSWINSKLSYTSVLSLEEMALLLGPGHLKFVR